MNKLTLFILVLLCCFNKSLTAQTDHELVLKALDYQEIKDYEKAIVYYTRAIDSRGTMSQIPEVYLERGTCYFRMKKYRKALFDLDYGLELDETNYGLYIQRAMIFYALIKPDYAIDDFNQAISYVDDDSVKINIQLNLGSAKMMKRDFSGAREIFEQILKLDPNHVPALTNLGVALNNLGEAKTALVYLKKAVEVDPKDPAGHVNIGFHHLRHQEFDNAITHFDKAIELKPNTALAYNNRGFAYLKLGQLNQALNDVNKSLKLFPKNAFAFKNRALIFLEMEMNDKACNDLSTAIDQKYTQQYGDEVKQLIEKNCNKK